MTTATSSAKLSNMSISQYLSPIQPDSLGYYPSEFSVTLGSRIFPYHPGDEIPEHSLVLLGVGEDRGAEFNAGCGGAPDEIRRYGY